MSLRSKIIAYSDGGRLFWVMVGMVAFVVMSYLYAVNRTVVLVAQRNTLESQISANRDDVTTLESSYIGEKNDVTMELAQSLGYGQATQTVYMPKRAVSLLTHAETIQ